MSQGKHLSLEEARKQNQLKRFCKEHPSEGNEEVFDRLLDAMAPRPNQEKKDDG